MDIWDANIYSFSVFQDMIIDKDILYKKLNLQNVAFVISCTKFSNSTGNLRLKMPQLRKNRKRIYYLIMWNQVFCKLTEKKIVPPNSYYFTQKSNIFKPLYLAKEFLGEIWRFKYSIGSESNVFIIWKRSFLLLQLLTYILNKFDFLAPCADCRGRGGRMDTFRLPSNNIFKKLKSYLSNTSEDLL